MVFGEVCVLVQEMTDALANALPSFLFPIQVCLLIVLLSEFPLMNFLVDTFVYGWVWLLVSCVFVV